MTFMNLHQQEKYLNKTHAKLPNGQYMLKKPMFVFKKIHTYSPGMDFVVEQAFKDKKELDLKQIKGKVSRLKNGSSSIGMQTLTGAIANLILPTGTIVNPPQDHELKMRADKAIVHSVVRTRDNKQVYFGQAIVNSTFIYPSLLTRLHNPNDCTGIDMADNFDTEGYAYWMNDLMVRPTDPFSLNTATCETGIHFFMNLHSAINY